ncbi:transposase [Streptomyces sp. NPDC004787]|uniref:transposase n=1 Tax=Streptomyces sp. NPDC004787 TaxID=3154291 RepID=UPI0033A2C8A5
MRSGLHSRGGCGVVLRRRRGPFVAGSSCGLRGRCFEQGRGGPARFDAAWVADRTDADAHRQLPADRELAQAVAVLARARQDAVWGRTQAGNKLRPHLREYFPGHLAAVQPITGGFNAPVARALLAAAPTPGQAARLTRTQLKAALKRAGRQRGHRRRGRAPPRRPARPADAPAPAGRDRDGPPGPGPCWANSRPPATPQTTSPKPPSRAAPRRRGHHQLPRPRRAQRHPVLAEIGDDRTRFAGAKALKAYAGSAPVTRASGKSHAVMVRRVKNQRLAAVGYVWAFASLTASPGARAHYDRRRKADDRHSSAPRNPYNRLLGCLHHCLATSTPYNETTAFPAPPKIELAIAA